MDWYIAKKDGIGIDIGDPTMIEMYEKAGYEIYKMQEVRVDNVQEELAVIKANAMPTEWNPEEEN